MKNYPAKRTNGNVPARRNQYPVPTSPFSNNLANNMNFGGVGHDTSGFVKREMVIIDSNGNKQIAREVQFFNSGKNIGRVEINDSIRAKRKKI